MLKDTEKRGPLEPLWAAISSGDADTVLLHAVDAGVTVEDFERAIAEISLIKALQFEAAAKKVGSGSATGVEHNGKSVTLVWDNSLEKERAEKFRKFAEILVKRSMKR